MSATKGSEYNQEFPGVSGHKCQQSRWGLRTGDGVRQEAPGARSAGTGGKGPAEKLTSWEGPPKAAQLQFYRRNKWRKLR